MAVRRVLKGALGMLAIAAPLSLPYWAATGAITDATVTRTLASEDDRFGGCMARLDKSAADEGLNVECPASPWVTFSCSGVHTSKSNALRMFDSAQMAFALGRTVRVEVDDSRKHNGFCFVRRIDVNAPAPAEDPAPAS